MLSQPNTFLAEAGRRGLVEAVRLCVAYRDYVCGTTLDLSKGTTANLQHEHVLAFIRHGQCNNCFVQVGPQDVTRADDVEV
jgi:hypothetical protein